jgi:thioester reductase-like protein
MQGFLTSATGVMGSFLVPELINARHPAGGPSRSDASAEGLNDRFITSVRAPQPFC